MVNLLVLSDTDLSKIAYALKCMFGLEDELGERINQHLQGRDAE